MLFGGYSLAPVTYVQETPELPVPAHSKSVFTTAEFCAVVNVGLMLTLTVAPLGHELVGAVGRAGGIVSVQVGACAKTKSLRRSEENINKETRRNIRIISHPLSVSRYLEQ
jgi:hypothetical protein